MRKNGTTNLQLHRSPGPRNHPKRRWLFFEDKDAKRCLLYTANNVLPQQFGRRVSNAPSRIVQYNDTLDTTLSQSTPGDFPEMFDVLLKTFIEFSGFGHGALGNRHPHFSDSSNNRITIGIYFSQRKDILKPLAHVGDSPEQIHRLPKHMLDDDKRRVCAKFEIGGPGATYQRLSYFYQRRHCPFQALMDRWVIVYAR